MAASTGVKGTHRELTSQGSEIPGKPISTRRRLLSRDFPAGRREEGLGHPVTDKPGAQGMGRREKMRNSECGGKTVQIKLCGRKSMSRVAGGVHRFSSTETWLEPPSTSWGAPDPNPSVSSQRSLLMWPPLSPSLSCPGAEDGLPTPCPCGGSRPGQPCCGFNPVPQAPPTLTLPCGEPARRRLGEAC